MSAPLPEGSLHLVMADSAAHLVLADCGLADRLHRAQHPALCGTLVSSSPACPPDCDHDHPMCPECVCEAGRAVGWWIAR